jgi:hypothetical protein
LEVPIKIAYTYDPNDLCVRQEYVDSEGSTETIFAYDEYGNLIEKKDYGCDGELRLETNYEYIAVNWDKLRETAITPILLFRLITILVMNAKSYLNTLIGIH